MSGLPQSLGRFALLLLALLFGGCAEAPKYPPAVLEQAAAAGRLEAIHVELAAAVRREQSADEALLADLRAVTDRLVSRDLDALRAELEAARLPVGVPGAGLVPLTAFAGFAAAVDAPGRWSGAGRERAVTIVTTENARTQGAIGEARRVAIALPRAEHAERLRRYAEIAALGGPGSAEEAAWKRLAVDTASSLRQEALSAIAADRPDAAAALLATLRALPGPAATDSAAELAPYLERLASVVRLLRVNAVMRLAGSQGAGDSVESAWSALDALDREVALAGLRPEGDAALGELRAAALRQAAAAQSAGRLDAAYGALLRSRWLARLLEIRATSAAEDAFVDRLQRLADTAAARGEYATELACRLVVGELQPDYPMLPVTLQEARQRVREDAVPRVALAPWRDGGQVDGLGIALAARLHAVLGERLRDDVRFAAEAPAALVAPESAAAGSESLAPGSAAAGSATGPAPGRSPRWRLSGEVREAALTIQTDERLDRRRVQTDTQRRDNPAFREWTALAPEARGQAPAPPETLDVPVYENIAIGITTVRKQARLSVAVELIDVGSGGRVVLAETANGTREALGERSGAIELGEFVQPARADPLPADGEMIDALAAEAITQLAERVVATLAGQEQARLALAVAARAAGDRAAELAHRAAALVIAEDKGLEAAALRDALRETLLAPEERGR